MRWDELRVEEQERRQLPGYKEPAAVRTFDAPEAMNIRFYEVHAKSALNRVPKQSQVPFRWTVNPYRGCTHACVWCFARPTHTFLDLNAREDFEREIVVKVNAPEVLRRELSKPSWTREHIALGTNTDPYQWVESRYKLMPGIWEAIRDSGTPSSVLTKSPLLLRDVELMKEIHERSGFTASLSVPTIDEKVWRQTEPHTPHPRARLEAIGELHRAGLPTGVLIAPLMPGVNDAPEQVEPILDMAAEMGADNVIPIALHLRGEVKDIWFEWLEEHRPDLIERYRELYKRGAYAPREEKERLARIARPKVKAKGPRYVQDPPDEEPRAPAAVELEQPTLF